MSYFLAHRARSRAVAVILASAAVLLLLAGAIAHADGAFQGRIVYASDETGNFDIFSINRDGSGKQQLTNDAADDFDPSWDGSRIAFVRSDGGDRDIWVMNEDGSGATRLTTGNASNRYPSWSPDGKQIAFRSNRRPSSSFDIWRMGADGAAPVRVTADPAMWGQSLESSPAWSPDGSQIAFVSDRDGNREIYVAGADGSSPHRLTHDTAADEFPAWSPDGSQIAFVSDRDGNQEIYVMRSSDGGGQANLTRHPSADRYPAWSPDGAQIVFRSARGKTFDAYLMNADGSGVTRLTYGSGRKIQPGFEGSDPGSNPPADDQQAAGGPGGAGSTPGGSVGSGAASALKLQLSAPKNQHVVRQRGIVVFVRCSHACALAANGSVLVRGSKKRFALGALNRQLVAGRRARVKLPLSGRRLTSVRRLLAQGRQIRATLSVVAGGPDDEKAATTALICRR